MMLFQPKSYLITIGSASLAFLTIFASPARAQRLTGQQRTVSAVSRLVKAIAQTLFDDFSYANYRQLARHGWIIRTEAGWTGVPGSMWGNSGVSFPADPDLRVSRWLRMTSLTEGNGM